MGMTVDPSFGTTIIPYLPIIGLVTVALLGGLVRLWNRRRGATETKMPSVAEAWARAENASREVDMERNLRRQIEALFWALVAAFRAYVARVQHGGDTTLTPEEQAALAARPTVTKEETP